MTKTMKLSAVEAQTFSTNEAARKMLSKNAEREADAIFKRTGEPCTVVLASPSGTVLFSVESH